MRSRTVKLSVIVPMLNEATAIAAALDAIRARAPTAEIIVVDGGSHDGSVEIARPRCDLLIESSRGRARQMNIGAAAAGGDAFVFVHADTIMPPRFAGDIEAALRDPGFVGGRFDLQLDDTALSYRALGALISIRSRLMRTVLRMWTIKSLFLAGVPPQWLKRHYADTR